MIDPTLDAASDSPAMHPSYVDYSTNCRTSAATAS
jgi:hypothetical protein